MVSVCVSNGPAQAKRGVPQAVAFAGAALASRLNNRGGAWANWVAPFIGVVSFEVDNFCTTEPVAMPTITLNDVLAVLNPASLGNFTAIEKFKDVILNILWYELCECVSGAQPTPTPVPAQPAGSPDTSGVFGNTGPSLPCAAKENTVFITNSSSFALVLWPTDGNGNNTTFTLPPGVTSIRVHSLVTTQGAGPHVTSYNISMQVGYAAHSTTTHNSVTHTPVGVEYIDDFTLTNTDATGLILEYACNAGNATDKFYGKVEVFCGTTPGGTGIACCPADQYTTGLLLSMLQAVTLIQRQHVPFAYVPGHTHPSLSGNGEFSVQGILGLLIELASVPGRAGELAGHPETIYSVGWVNVGTADGWLTKHVVEHSPMLVLDVPGTVTRVGYSLPSDVSATITELVREA